MLLKGRPPPGPTPEPAAKANRGRDASHQAQVFQDPRHRRRRIVIAIAVAVGCALVAWFVLFAFNLYLVEKLPGTALIGKGESQITAMSAAPPEGGLRGGLLPSVCVSSPFPQLAPSDDAADLIRLPTDEVWAYLPYLPENSYASLAAGIRHIDTLLVEWFRISAPEGRLTMLNRTSEAQTRVAGLIAAARGGMRIAPVATVGPGALDTGATGPTQRATLAREIVAAAGRDGASGFCLMPAGIAPDEAPALADLLARLDAGLNAQGLTSCLIAGSGSGLIGDPAFGNLVDRVVFKAFAEPWLGEPPGPLAPAARFGTELEAALDAVGRERLVVMLGSFATDWSRNTAAPETIPVAEAMARVGRGAGSLDFPEAVGNLRLRYADRAGYDHEVWMLDAASLYNQMLVLTGFDLRRVGLWSLGFEDPSAWPLFAARNITPELAALYIGRIDLSDFVSYEGKGAFHKLVKPAEAGRRFGEVSPEMVALTFDDGPSPDYTAEMLDVLRDRDAKATFFVVGSKVLAAPDLVRRMHDEGHEIGSHTFLHPALETVPDLRTTLELNAVQRLLGVVTGHGTMLFRDPYGRGEGPITGRAAAPMKLIEDGGYVIVGSDVVPPDWLSTGAEGIVDYAMTWLATEGGNVIVLHDGGGDRSATVAALGPLIDRLRADGYRIVSLSEMLGVSPEAVMPAAVGPAHLLDLASFGVIGVMGRGLVALFWVIVLAGVLRALVVLFLAHLRRPHPAQPPQRAPAPPVTVLIPAFNEEATILRCVASVFASDYPDLRVIVVDDGSTDHTFSTIASVAAQEPRLRLVHEANAGKWAALDLAYSSLETEIVVAIDADSMVAPEAISAMVRHFADPKVGAVAGKVQVGNRVGLLTRLQALEYLTAQNIDRRAAEVMNAMLVVPGAIGAWRAEAVRAAGLYSPQTVTEDADLTVSVIRAGYRVVYEEAALAVTEAPETVGALMRQRLRWSFGMLQTAVKHIGGAMRQRKAVGLVMLPDLLLVGFGLAALAPLADLILVSTLLDLLVDVVLGRPQAAAGDARVWMILGYAALPLLDVAIILAALRFDRSESIWLVLLIPLQRFFYRQLLYITAWRAMIRAVIGKLAHWGKLARTGSAQLPGQGGSAPTPEADRRQPAE